MKRNERTHQENQERAYIAASRRSDRSIEARIESAKRASELHKQRTGKALRVTEQDVLNEEMYEEEEAELPAQYRNLNAHLKTDSADFDARLQAYLANAVAFRKALAGVTKPGDKAMQHDFVNCKQYADHDSLFPRHSDAWKDIAPKLKQSSGSAVTSGNKKKEETNTGASKAPYDPKASGLHARRQSVGQAAKLEQAPASSNLTLSDLKPRHAHVRPYQPVARHPSLPQPALRGSLNNSPAPMEEDLRRKTIDYAALQVDDVQEILRRQDSEEGLFSATLPMNAQQLLLPQTYSEPATFVQQDPHFFSAALWGTTQEKQTTIDSTLAPVELNWQFKQAVAEEDDFMQQAIKPASSKLATSNSNQGLEDSTDLWSRYMDDDDAWDWNTITA
ncbi:hypothetical protein BCR37DRAFT_388416 [Protomyces lactucae-debilis]|uniref:Uncharacterized protein n=1 Tax=Protomyces lactucae-debilis TaxID=2754530 RepID=A0A1Y2F7C2_PROLT|nr:uncharacterized protein BCR37DRAFT_388416 [Protomyces lactucae-debilis]ORY79384.1 hypothetical protein BCR37DRAFT_388416 [Protomyces lactucae-debilis]